MIINFRGAHAPYNDLLEDKYKKFPQDYDNKVLQTDSMWAEVIKYLQHEKAPVFAIFTGDHGESLGEVYGGKKWESHSAELSIAPEEQKQTPLIIYVNEAYKKLYPQYVKNIAKNMKKYSGGLVESDMISHSLLHCSMIEGSVVNKQLSLCRK
jgi:glucan phosphoethanolaminetransferase (alkaline phosphatase superfamily)